MAPCVNVYVCVCLRVQIQTIDHEPLIGKQNHVCESVCVSVCACANSDVQIQTIDADH